MIELFPTDEADETVFSRPHARFSVGDVESPQLSPPVSRRQTTTGQSSSRRDTMSLSMTMQAEDMKYLRHGKGGMELPTMVPYDVLGLPADIRDRRGLSAVVVGPSEVMVVGGYSFKTGEWRPTAAILKEEDEAGLTYPSHPGRPSEVRVNIGGPLTLDSQHSHTAALADGVVYVFGGLGFTHSVHGVVWDAAFYGISVEGLVVTDLSATIPRAMKRRRGHTAVVHDRTMYVCGGWGTHCDQWLRTMDCFHVPSQKWVSPKDVRSGFPPGIAHHTAVEANGSMIVFGGFMDCTPSRLRAEENDANEHKPFHLKKVESVSGNSKSTAASEGYHVPYGCDVDGSTSGYRPHPGEGTTTMLCTNALYSYTFATREWKHRQSIGEVPDPRSHHAAAMCEGRMFLTGGEGSRVFNDVYVLDVVMLVWCCVDLETPPRPLTGHAVAVLGGRMIWIGGAPTSVYYHVPRDTNNDKSPKVVRGPRSKVPTTECIVVQRAMAYANVKRHYVLSQLKASDGDAKPKLILRKQSVIQRQVCRMMITKLVKLDATPPKLSTSSSAGSPRAVRNASGTNVSLPRCVTPAEGAKASERLYDPAVYTKRSNKLVNRYPVLVPLKQKPPMHGDQLRHNGDRLFYRENRRRADHYKELYAKHVVDPEPVQRNPETIETVVGRLYSKGKEHEKTVAQALTKKYYHGSLRQLRSQQTKHRVGAEAMTIILTRLTVSAQQQRAHTKQECYEQYFESRQQTFPTYTEEQTKAIFNTFYEDGMIKKKSPGVNCKHV